MTTKLFILGRPGSGKSKAARRIMIHADQRSFSAIHINDYPILLKMAQADTNYQYFYPTKYANGFDVHNFSVMNIALKRLQEKANEYIRRVELIIIEFARNDYQEALKQFSSPFIEDAFFLFLDSDTATCKSRIYERTAHPKSSDDYYVSDDIVEVHYGKDNREYIIKNFRHEYHVPVERLWILDNMRQLEDFEREVDFIAHKLLRFKTRILPETDPLQPIFKSVNECKAPS